MSDFQRFNESESEQDRVSRFNAQNGLVNMAYDVIEMHQELVRLRREVARLQEVEERHNELVQSSLAHSRHMVGGLMQIAMMPGVLDAISKNNEATTPT